MKNNAYIINFHLNYDNIHELESSELYLYQGKKPSLKQLEKWADNLGYDSIISDIQESPKDRRLILEEYISVIKCIKILK